MFEEVCALYDAEEPYEHLVYSSFAYFILKVDPYLTTIHYLYDIS